MPADTIALAVSPAPTYSGAQMIIGLKAYRELQHALDQQMPDQLLALDGKVFRKKGYWRAIALAFNLTVQPVTAERDERMVVGELEDGTSNFVYAVTYRASMPTGRSTTGDGSCSAAEKTRGKLRATEHNVRSHAHTRAFNRAVSNLVGFGEVSAEEIGDEPAPARSKPVAAPVKKPAATITAAQRTRLFAIAKEVGWSKEELKVWLESHGYASSSDIGILAYDKLIALIQMGGDEPRSSHAEPAVE